VLCLPFNKPTYTRMLSCKAADDANVARLSDSLKKEPIMFVKPQESCCQLANKLENPLHGLKELIQKNENCFITC
jgi:hypothetical protein